MGYPYNELVAPAVLFLNPGITRERFVELLDNTHSSQIHEYGRNDAWDHWTEHTQDDSYHKGLEGLAYKLIIGESDRFKKFNRPAIDQYGLQIEAPVILPLDERRREEKGYTHEAVIHERNILGRIKTIEKLSWCRLSVGDIWREVMMGFERGVVTKILEEQYLGQKKEESSDDDDDSDDDFGHGPEYRYKMQIKPLTSRYRRDLFKSEEEMYKVWPQFHPDFRYNWSRESGGFSVFEDGVRKFRWEQHDGKYTLSDETFNNIKASGFYSCWGYVDLIMTAEAIKRNAWKVLSRKGNMYFGDFMDDFLEVRQIYEKATWDAHTSLFAKSRGMSVSDLLRARLVGFSPDLY
jgi:hypothetical protein